MAEPPRVAIRRFEALVAPAVCSRGWPTSSRSSVSRSDLLDFSLVNYTSLGYDDIVPLGPARVLAGVESFVGLVLIAWTASFTHFEMRRYGFDDSA